MKKLNILVACEESQAVTKELRLLGHNAFSCDLLPCSGGHPEWHFNMDVFEVIDNKGGILQNDKKVKIKDFYHFITNWMFHYSIRNNINFNITGKTTETKISINIVDEILFIHQTN